MFWSKLVDRCELLVSSDRGLLLSLLYEAEEELTRECDVVEDRIEYTFTGSESNLMGIKGVVALPNRIQSENLGTPSYYNFSFSIVKKIIKVSINGQDLSPSFETDFNLDNSNDGYVDQHQSSSPIISDIYHKDLVYYACYISTIKSNPSEAQGFKALWDDSIRKIKNQEGDREMIANIREVI